MHAKDDDEVNDATVCSHERYFLFDRKSVSYLRLCIQENFHSINTGCFYLNTNKLSFLALHKDQKIRQLSHSFLLTITILSWRSLLSQCLLCAQLSGSQPRVVFTNFTLTVTQCMEPKQNS